MSHKRLTIFLGVLLALLIVPTTLPYILGHLILPWWAFAFYAIIILVNAGIYLIQRCLLIDRFFVQGRIGLYVLSSIAVFFLGLGLQYLAHSVFSRFEVADGVTVQEVISFDVQIAQLTLMSVLQLVTTFIALAVGMSDEWRMAAFRYHEAEKNKRSLEKDVERLQGQVDALKQSESGDDTITVKVDLLKRNLRLDDILYVKSDGDYIVFHLSDGQAPMVLMTLKALEKKLPFGRFCRIHRSYLVNRTLASAETPDSVSVGGISLPVSRKYKERVQESLGA